MVQYPDHFFYTNWKVQLKGGCFIQSCLVLCPSQIPADRVSLTVTCLQPKCFFPPHVPHPWPEQGEGRQLPADLLPAQCPSWVRTWDVNGWKAKENMRKRKISYVVSRQAIHFTVSTSISRLSPSMLQNTTVILQLCTWWYQATDIMSVSIGWVTVHGHGWVTETVLHSCHQKTEETLFELKFQLSPTNSTNVSGRDCFGCLLPSCSGCKEFPRPEPHCQGCATPISWKMCIAQRMERGWWISRVSSLCSVHLGPTAQVVERSSACTQANWQHAIDLTGCVRCNFQAWPW